MSRVLSRRRPVAFCCGCVSDSSGAADRVLEMREMPQPRLAREKLPDPARKLSVHDPSATCQGAKRQPPRRIDRVGTRDSHIDRGAA